MEEDDMEPFIDMIRFLYCGKFQNIDMDFLIRVLFLADKYGIIRAVKESSRLLSQVQMTMERCKKWLILPESIFLSQVMIPIIQKIVNFTFSTLKISRIVVRNF
jgi:hypothetical protein